MVSANRPNPSRFFRNRLYDATLVDRNKIAARLSTSVAGAQMEATDADGAIVVEVSTTQCTPLSGQLARLSASDLRTCAGALGIRGPTLTDAELARAVAAAIFVTREK